jgi:hypothetical protein
LKGQEYSVKSIVAMVLCTMLAAVALTSCNAAKTNSQTYTAVPAITGQWLITTTNSQPVSWQIGTLQVTLVSVPCSSLWILPSPATTTVPSVVSSCSLADNFNGTGSITGTGTDNTDPSVDYSSMVFIVESEVVTDQSTGATTTGMFTTLIGCSAQCVGGQGVQNSIGVGYMTSAGSTFSGTWNLDPEGASVFTATQQQ